MQLYAGVLFGTVCSDFMMPYYANYVNKYIFIRTAALVSIVSDIF